jgi:hypothetical protein
MNEANTSNNKQNPLRDLSDLLFELKEHISDDKYLKAMNMVSSLHGLGKKVLIAIPQAHEIHLDSYHKRFDLGVELVYVTLTKEDYPLYNELEAGTTFEIDLYPPLMLLYKSGVFKYSFINSTSMGIGPLSNRDDLSCQSITGKVIQCYPLKPGLSLYSRLPSSSSTDYTDSIDSF